MQFILGTLPNHAIRLPNGDSNLDYEDYMKKDGIVLSWIKATVSKEIQPLLIPCTTVFEAWKVLEEDISPIDENSIQTLRNEMNSLKKTSDLTMKEYFLKFKALRNSLAAAGYNMTDDRVQEYVLRGLGPEFRFFRTLLNQRETTTFPQLAELLIKEEILMKELDHQVSDETFRVNCSNHRNARYNRGGRFGGYYLRSKPPIAKNNLPPILNLLPSQDTSMGC